MKFVADVAFLSTFYAEGATISLQKIDDSEVYLISATDFRPDSFSHFIVQSACPPNFEIGLAYYRYGPWKAWTKPVQIGLPFPELENDVQFFLWKDQSGKYGAIVPLIDNGFRTTIGFCNQHLHLDIYSGAICQPKQINMAIVGTDCEPYRLINNLYQKAWQVMGINKNNSIYKNFPNTFDYIGYCTWNGMGTQVNAEKIIAQAEFFKQNHFVVPNLIIDDGWLTLSADRKLMGFDACPIKFPDGLAHLTHTLKTHYGLKHIGVWHTLNGYWMGLDSESEVGRQYPLFAYLDQETHLRHSHPKMQCYIANPFEPIGFEFFEHFHQYLKEQGIDFVKVDNQLITERIALNQVAVGHLAKAIFKSLNTSVAKNFEGAILNCMDMTIDAAYHFPESVVARIVEDYFPFHENQNYHLEHGNAASHILCALFNNVWWHNIAIPDFDMFQTHHPNALMHAVARALSGGPIYFTDELGKTDFDLLKQLVLSDGKILRTDSPFLPTIDCLFNIEQTTLLKAFTKSGDIRLMAIFHTADAEILNCTYSSADVWINEPTYIFDYFSREVTISDASTIFNIALPRMGVGLKWIAPANQPLVALGLLNKFNGPAAILDQKGDIYTRLSLTIADGGLLGFAFNPEYAVPVERIKFNVEGQPSTPFEIQIQNNLIILPLNKKGITHVTIYIE